MYSATDNSLKHNAPKHIADYAATPSPLTPARRSTYDRARDLPRLLPLWPNEVAIKTPAGHAALIARLRRALRAERQRGIAGHWTYNLARHADLLRAYRAELAEPSAARNAV
jgi:hypothetical protein